MNHLNIRTSIQVGIKSLQNVTILYLILIIFITARICANFGRDKVCPAEANLFKQVYITLICITSRKELEN
jgi:hypothetical protein